MIENLSNDNGVARSGGQKREPDANGQAAMLLVESLIYGLVAQSLISVAAAMDIVDVAMAVKGELGTEMGDSPATLGASVDMLEAIKASLSHDIDKNDTRPGPRSII